jgi:hypothetical protein
VISRNAAWSWRKCSITTNSYPIQRPHAVRALSISLRSSPPRCLALSALLVPPVSQLVGRCSYTSLSSRGEAAAAVCVCLPDAFSPAACLFRLSSACCRFLPLTHDAAICSLVTLGAPFCNLLNDTLTSSDCLPLHPSEHCALLARWEARPSAVRERRAAATRARVGTTGSLTLDVFNAKCVLHCSAAAAAAAAAGLDAEPLKVARGRSQRSCVSC